MLGRLLVTGFLLLAAGGGEDPARVVDALYRGHFAHSQRFDQTLVRERSRFASGLIALLDADGKALAAHVDAVVGLDFDPLTNAQEEASGYEIGAVGVMQGTRTVPVSVRFGSERTKLVVRLVQEQGAWKVADVETGEGSLVKTLQQLARERTQR